MMCVHVRGSQVKLEGGVPLALLFEGLDAAAKGREKIIQTMESALPKARKNPKPSAPRVNVVRFRRQRMSDLLGAGGQTKREIEAECGCIIDTVEVEPDATIARRRGNSSSAGAGTGRAAGTSLAEQVAEVCIFAETAEDADRARSMVQDLVCDIELGQVFKGTVKEVSH